MGLGFSLILMGLEVGLSTEYRKCLDVKCGEQSDGSLFSQQ